VSHYSRHDYNHLHGLEGQSSDDHTKRQSQDSCSARRRNNHAIGPHSTPLNSDDTQSHPCSDVPKLLADTTIPSRLYFGSVLFELFYLFLNLRKVTVDVESIRCQPSKARAIEELSYWCICEFSGRLWNIAKPLTIISAFSDHSSQHSGSQPPGKCDRTSRRHGQH